MFLSVDIDSNCIKQIFCVLKCLISIKCLSIIFYSKSKNLDLFSSHLNTSCLAKPCCLFSAPFNGSEKHTNNMFLGCNKLLTVTLLLLINHFVTKTVFNEKYLLVVDTNQFIFQSDKHVENTVANLK